MPLPSTLISPQTPCHVCRQQSQNKWGSATAQGDFPGFAYLPSSSGSSAQLHLAETSLRELHGQGQLQTTIPNIQALCLTHRLRPLLQSALTGKVVLCLEQLCSAAGVVQCYCPFSTKSLSFHLTFVNMPCCIQGSALAQGSSHRTRLGLLPPPQLCVRAFPTCLPMQPSPGDSGNHLRRASRNHPL